MMKLKLHFDSVFRADPDANYAIAVADEKVLISNPISGRDCVEHCINLDGFMHQLRISAIGLYCAQYNSVEIWYRDNQQRSVYLIALRENNYGR